jgi:hypothetical protein
LWLENKISARGLTAAAKAGAVNQPVIAALKRCATQNQVQRRVFQQPEAADFWAALFSKQFPLSNSHFQ